MSYEPERLFRPKLVRALIDRLAPHTAGDFHDNQTVLGRWRETVLSNQPGESQLETAFAQQILGKILGYQGVGEGERLDYRFKENTGTGRIPDITMGREIPGKGWQPCAILELKSPNLLFHKVLSTGKTPIEQAWDYANILGNIEWVILSNFRTIRLYSYRQGQKYAEDFDLFLASEKNENGKNEYNRIVKLLCCNSLLQFNYTTELLNETIISKQEVTNEFYGIYRSTRDRFRQEIIRVSPDLDRSLALTKAQSLLNRIIFISFCENSLPPLLTKNTLSNIWNQRNPFDDTPLRTYFLKLFRAIDLGNEEMQIPAYNGGLFQFDEILDRLDLDYDQLRYSIQKLTGFYFEENLSVTILGNIFENSIREIEQEKNSEFGQKKREGVVYTPDVSAEFIIQSTFNPKLNQIWQDCLLDSVEDSPAVQAIIESIGSSQFNRFNANHLVVVNWRHGFDLVKFWQAYRERIKALRIIDPACGSGAFLVMAYQFLKTEFDRVSDCQSATETGYSSVIEEERINSQILRMLCGADLNPEAVEISKLSLWIKTAQMNRSLDSIDGNFYIGDSLLADPDLFFPEIVQAGGFDIVVGNPPYVRQELISELKDGLEKNYRVYHGQADLFVYFYELGLRLLKPDGYLGFITSNSFLKSGSATVLRQMLRRETTLHMAYNLGDNQYFNQVTTYPIILVTCKRPPERDHRLHYSSLGYDDHVVCLDDLAIFYQEHNNLYPQDELTDHEWQLEESELYLLRQKIIKGRKKLAEVYGEPIYGIKTGLNEAFIIDEATKNRLVREDPASKDLIKPVLKGADVRRWHVNNKGRWMIFARQGTDIEKYPAIHKHLKKFKSKLTPRPKNWNTKKQGVWAGRSPGTYRWYEIQSNIAFWQNLEQPKIIWPNICIGSRFVIDNKNYYINDKSFLLPCQSWDLLAYLNSTLVWFYLQGKCSLLRGGYLQLRTLYTRTIPIPDMTLAQREGLAELGLLCQSLAEQMQQIGADFEPVILQYLPPVRQESLTAKQREWWAHENFEKFTAQTKIKIPPKDLAEVKSFYQQKCNQWHDTHAALMRAESAINQLVYQIFDLTPSEIAIIEESTKGMEDMLED